MEQQHEPFVFIPTRKKKSKAVKRYEREQAARAEAARKAALDPTFAAEKLTSRNVPRLPWNDVPVASWDTASLSTGWASASDFSTSTFTTTKPAPVNPQLAKVLVTESKSASAWDKPLVWGQSTGTPAVKTQLAAIPEDWEEKSKKQWAAEQARNSEPPRTDEQLRQERLTEAMIGWPWKNQPEKQLTMVYLIS